MKTIVYFGSDGMAAQRRVSALRAEIGDDAQAILASAYVGERIKADQIEFMPDVAGWHKDAIEKAFERQKRADEVAAEREAERKAGLPPLKRIDEDSFRRSMTARFTEPVKEPVKEAVKEPPPVEPVPPERDLKAEAESLGVKVDGRWSEKRIAAEIKKAKG